MTKLLIVLDLEDNDCPYNIDYLNARVIIDMSGDVLEIHDICKLQELPKSKHHNDYDNETLRAYKNGWNSCLGEIIEYDLWK